MNHQDANTEENIVNAPNSALHGEGPTSVTSSAVPAQASVWHRIFRSPNGIRSGWRLVIYVGMVAVIALLLQRVTLAIPIFAATIHLANHGVLSPGAEFLIEGVGIVATFVGAWVMSKI